MANIHFSTFELERVTTRMAEDHAKMLEQKLESVLNEHGIALDAPGVDLKVTQKGVQFVYTVLHNDVAISTFGFELDLFGVKDYSRPNDLDLSKILV